MPYADVNGSQLYYEEHGEGPMVLLHGDGQVLRTPVPVGAACWPTSQDN